MGAYSAGLALGMDLVGDDLATPGRLHPAEGPAGRFAY